MLITRQNRSEAAAKAYLYANPMDTEKVPAIEALGCSTNADRVEEILGTDEFTKVVCTGCGRHVEAAIRLVDSYQYCLTCLLTATTILEAHNASSDSDTPS